MISLQVIALLRVLFNGDNQGSHHLYMSLIVLLLLSEDEGFNSNIHNIVRPSSPVFFFFFFWFYHF